jgi:hypothetical protein
LVNERDIPLKFDREFLDWFRHATEKAWEAVQPGSLGWQPGTRWTSPLTDVQIDGREREWGMRFPGDYRLFLKTLHTVTPQPKYRQYEFEDHSEIVTKISFPNWLTDREDIQKKLAWPLDGLFFDLENNALWLDAWGPKPEPLSSRKQRLQQIYGKAPKLLPLMAHRYLLADPCREQNIVLSVYQSDIINYGDTLRDYFLIEFCYELGLNRDTAYSHHATKLIESIPFWGAVAQA